VGISTVTYAYDALGRPTSVTDNNDPNDANDNSTVNWTYTRENDGDLEVEESQEYGAAADRVLTSTYDLSGRLKSLEYPSGLTLSYTYDDLGRITAVNDGTNDRVADTYTGRLLEKREYHNGTYLTHLDDSDENLDGYGYDSFGRIKNHRWMNSGDQLIAGWSYDYDRIANKDYQEDLKDSTESELYGYDTVYRLTDFERGQLNEQKDDITNPSRTQTWTLDPLGNWDDTTIDATTETRTHNDVNELTDRTVGQDPQIDLTYDNAGNLIQDGDENGNHKYTWDYRNRLIEVQEKQSGNWNTLAEYKYDPSNRRVLKVVTNKGALNGATRYIWGGDSDWQCLEELDGSDDLVARYTYAPGYIDSPAVQERDLNGDDDFTDDDEVVYYHSNTLASIYALSDADENVIERYRYDAYGAATVLDADFSDDADNASDVENPYLYTARRVDAETALMQYRNREYAPALGRFLQRDPIDYVDFANLYHYVEARVTFWTDPLGLAPRKKWCCTKWRPVWASDGTLWNCVRSILGDTRFSAELEYAENYRPGWYLLDAVGHTVGGEGWANPAGKALGKGADVLKGQAHKSWGRAGGLTRWGRPGARAANRAGHAAWKASKALKGAQGALAAGSAVYGGGRFIIGKAALANALRTCEKEMCWEYYTATVKVVKRHKFWFDKVKYCCPKGGDLVNDRHARRQP